MAQRTQTTQSETRTSIPAPANDSVSFGPLVETFQSVLREDQSARQATFEAESGQIEGLRSHVKIRSFTVAVDEPHTLGGTDTAPNPVEYVLAALASCQEITYRLYADRLGIPLTGVSVRAAGDLDLAGFFGVDRTARPGFTKVRLDVTLNSPAPAAALERLKEIVDAHCPVLDILSNPTPVTLRRQVYLEKAG